MKFRGTMFPEKLQMGGRQKSMALAWSKRKSDILMGHHYKMMTFCALLCLPLSVVRCIDLLTESLHSMKPALPLSPFYRGGN